MDILQKNYTKSDGETPMSFTLTDESVDRDMERIDLGGLRINQFKKNPIMFFQHESWEFPIGRWKNIRKENGKLTAEPEFFKDDERAEKVQKFVNAGMLQATSVGFMPEKIEDEEPDSKLKPILQDFFGRDKIRVIKRSELLEASIVTIPSNPNALREKSAELLKNGEIEKSDFEFMDGILKEKRDTPPPPEPEPRETAEKRGAVLNATNKNKLKKISELASEILSSAEREDNDDGKQRQEPPQEKEKLYKTSELLNVLEQKSKDKSEILKLISKNN